MFVGVVLALVCLSWSTQAFSLAFFHRKFGIGSKGSHHLKMTGQPAEFTSREEYMSFLAGESALPQGFRVGSAGFNFTPIEVDNVLPMTLTLIVADEPTDAWAAMFTRNRFPGGPIYVGKDRLASKVPLQAVVINNKISNVCPGGSADFGRGDSEAVCAAVAEQLGIADGGKAVFPSSTGIIGWKLPIDAMKGAVPAAQETLQADSIIPAAHGICTTDRYPKVRRSPVSSTQPWSLSGIAKGAGMIEPNMATMLSYLLTDLDLSAVQLQECLQSAVGSSFNRISVDGDQSTSDTVLLMSSKKVPAREGDLLLFQTELRRICEQLSEDIVRNGEGTQHVMKIQVNGCPSDKFARDLGRFVANSSLVKCAIAGCDPNVGRIVGAIGSFLGSAGVEAGGASLEPSQLTLSLSGIRIFEKGAFALDPAKERLLSDSMLDSQLYPADMPEHERNYPRHFKCVDIAIDCGGGSGSCEVIGSDLTKEYVEVNADYRS